MPRGGLAVILGRMTLREAEEGLAVILGRMTLRNAEEGLAVILGRMTLRNAEEGLAVILGRMTLRDAEGGLAVILGRMTLRDAEGGLAVILGRMTLRDAGGVGRERAMIAIDDYVVDVLMRDLVGHDRRPVCFLVYVWLAAESGRRDGAVEISYRELSENIGVSKSSVQGAVGWLVRRKLVSVSKARVTATPCYSVLSPWRKIANRERAKRG